MPHALQFLVLTVAGWVNRHQEDLIDYLREENRILREERGPRPLRLTDRRATSTRDARQATWPARIDAGGRYCHSGHDSPLVPEVDRPEVRRQSSKTARPPEDAPRDRQPRGADGGRARLQSTGTTWDNAPCSYWAIPYALETVCAWGSDAKDADTPVLM